MNDTLASMLTAIKNASMVGNKTAATPASKFKKAVLLMLKKNGYISDFKEIGDGVKKQFQIELAYDQTGNSRIQDIKRTSKLSQRIYKGYRNIKPVKYGYGMMVMTTPQGIMSETEAREKKIGGEALFIIW